MKTFPVILVVLIKNARKGWDDMVDSKDVKDLLFYERKNVWKEISEDQVSVIHDFSEGYKDFLNQCKTERECVKYIHDMCLNRNNSFISLKSAYKNKQQLHPGDKLYFIENKKAVMLITIGKDGLSEGIKIIGSHLDAPRLDLKPLPIYEDTEIGLIKTHYYGGVRKYQWVTIPLAIHGIIYKQDGTELEITIGEDENDPVFVISDLLPHLAAEQSKLTLKDAIPGESLNLVVGSVPNGDTEVNEKVKATILQLLNNKYGLVEKDFINAELEVVPAFKARDVGIDKSLVGGYGQDDRVCAYTSLMAFFDSSNTIMDKTSYCYFSDKEEVGSAGNTGAQADTLTFVTEMIAELLYLNNKKETPNVKSVLRDSVMLSADVTAAFDPNHKSVFESNNSSYLNRGIAITKYTGSGGKGGASDANAEFLNSVTKLFDSTEDIVWQICELGKIDAGGGGTIAKFAANLGINVLDAGVPVLAMHSPYEMTSKADIYMTYKAFKAFYENM